MLSGRGSNTWRSSLAVIRGQAMSPSLFLAKHRDVVVM